MAYSRCPEALFELEEELLPAPLSHHARQPVRYKLLRLRHSNLGLLYIVDVNWLTGSV